MHGAVCLELPACSSMGKNRLSPANIWCLGQCEIAGILDGDQADCGGAAPGAEQWAGQWRPATGSGWHRHARIAERGWGIQLLPQLHPAVPVELPGLEAHHPLLATPPPSGACLPPNVTRGRSGCRFLELAGFLFLGCILLNFLMQGLSSIAVQKG